MERYSDYNQTEAVVSAVIPGSIAEDLGIVPGSWILSIDGKKIEDVFDYRVREKVEELTLLVRDPQGELTEYEIEKDQEEDLGLDFENPMLTSCHACSNKCIFCFIDQLPPGMRQSLYFKDDDSRLSFLTGNYVTLTNIPEEELDRIISYRFSPLNLSVHTTNPELRVKMMKNPKAADLPRRLRKILAAGLEVNAQLVMIPGWNDGPELDRSLQDLTAEYPEQVRSIACVPLGMTKFREARRLEKLEAFQASNAYDLLKQLEVWQEKFLTRLGRRLVYASDEFYLLAGVPIPEADFYEGYAQLENGVGMLALFRDNMSLSLSGARQAGYLRPCRVGLPKQKVRSEERGIKRVMIATGCLVHPFLRQWERALAEAFHFDLEIRAIRNDFFGESITVTGLLVGQDVLAQTRTADFDVLLISESMLKRDEDIFLDNMSLTELAEDLGRPVLSFGESAEALYDGLNWLVQQDVTLSEVIA